MKILRETMENIYLEGLNEVIEYLKALGSEFRILINTSFQDGMLMLRVKESKV